MQQAVDGAGALVAVDGPAGVGKTSLLDASRNLAAHAGLLTLRARGAELERAFAFGVVRRLFDELLREGPRGSPSCGQRRAAPPARHDRR